MLVKFGDVFFAVGAEQSILIALLVVAILCTVAVIALSVVVVLMLKKRKAVSERELKKISVDARAAKREFTLGEEFQCNGLLVKAFYDLKPKMQTLDEYNIVTQEEFTQLEDRGELNGCYVIKPRLEAVGKDIVTVEYMGKTDSYVVSVSETTQGTPTSSEQKE